MHSSSSSNEVDVGMGQFNVLNLGLRDISVGQPDGSPDQDWLTNTPETRASSTLPPRQGSGSCILSVAADEVQSSSPTLMTPGPALHPAIGREE